MDPLVNKNAPKYIPVAKPYLTESEKTHLIQCINDEWISQGPKVKEFEQRIADLVGKKYGSACNSGTTALHLALAVCDLQPGDEVVIPNMTMVALANAVLMAGGTPVFCDSDKYSDVGNTSLNEIEKVITEKTKAVIIVHTYGEAIADYEKTVYSLQRRGLVVIEDCAESLGAVTNEYPAGCLGDLSVFSFYSNKNITTGEGGLVATNSPYIKQRLDKIRMHAFTPGQHFLHQERAFGYRMTDMQAAIGLAQLTKFNEIMRSRIAARLLYELNIKSDYVKIASTTYGSTSSGAWVLPLLCNEADYREDIRAHLANLGIDTRTYFQPLSRQPFLYKYKRKTYPNSERISEIGFYVGLYPSLTDEDILYICEGINSYEPKAANF